MTKPEIVKHDGASAKNPEEKDSLSLPRPEIWFNVDSNSYNQLASHKTENRENIWKRALRS